MYNKTGNFTSIPQTFHVKVGGFASVPQTFHVKVGGFASVPPEVYNIMINYMQNPLILYVTTLYFIFCSSFKAYNTFQ